MVEISMLNLSLLIEALVICLIIIILWAVLFTRQKKRDRKAAKKLVDQVKHQSKTRLEVTSSFLHEKYRFEGNQLEKAVKSIDKAEKKFIQNVINFYIKREASKLESLDASLAELIDTYKSLSPIMPDAETLAALESANPEEMAALRESNEKLTEELAITKETMGNMISEFGNMFGGGKDHELEQEQVVEKVQGGETTLQQIEKVETQDDVEIDELEVSQEGASEDTAGKAENKKSAAGSPPKDEPVVDDDDVDELLDSIDLSN